MKDDTKTPPLVVTEVNPNKCQCPDEGVLNPMMTNWYDSVTERPFVNHPPGECKCTNNIRLYRDKGGNELYLCSCCWLSSHTPVETK